MKQRLRTNGLDVILAFLGEGTFANSCAIFRLCFFCINQVCINHINQIIISVKFLHFFLEFIMFYSNFIAIGLFFKCKYIFLLATGKNGDRDLLGLTFGLGFNENSCSRSSTIVNRMDRNRCVGS